MYECAWCLELFPAKKMTVDHIVPVVPIDGHDSFDEVIKRLYCEMEGLQALCKSCHKLKTDEENAARRAAKEEKRK